MGDRSVRGGMNERPGWSEVEGDYLVQDRNDVKTSFFCDMKYGKTLRLNSL
jgi:hypothetical protein